MVVVMTDKYGDKYRVHNLVKFDYSERGEYVDENHTDKPLRNDEIVDLLNSQDARICALNKSLSESLPLWVFEKVINRRIESTENKEIKKELKELLKELK